ncbi:Hypothetical protein SMAX5B_009436 [Scophthalmus maximus]|uniref:Uncharacterized protein n=1 Tax=Scophthalmus maximus TaxID=52904 RepID=A0A2U9C6S4_SCOMX|nr:Hypothetical protein SMAX5B_009436 [Scophthalmus maximus]
MQRERESPHLRRVEPANVGTSVGRCWSREFRGRAAGGGLETDRQMSRTSPSNRAQSDMSGTVPGASGGKRD